jgi:hypothetical protein
MYNSDQCKELEKLGSKRIDDYLDGKSFEPTKDLYSNFWGNCWKLSFEYKVSNFAAEVGFFIDILGFNVNIFSSTYAMFTNPDQDSFFSVIKSQGNEKPTPPESIRLHFVVKDLFLLVNELKKKSLVVIFPPESAGEETDLYSALLETPSGINMELWGTKREDSW